MTTKTKPRAKYTAAMSARRLCTARPPQTPEAIPPELRERRQWVVWDYFDYGESKLRKVPVAAGSDRALKGWNTLTNWRSFDEVTREAQDRGGLGVGYVFDESDGFVGVDQDDAFDDEGSLKPWSRSICSQFRHTYGERTPSGRGIHHIGMGDRVVGKCKAAVGEAAGAVERYSQDRWFTFTGDVISDRPLADVRDAMTWLADTHFGGHATREDRSPAIASEDPELDVELAKVCVELLKDQRSHDAEDWRQVGYALKGTSESLKSVWLEFSRRWPECDDDECADRWTRFCSRSTVGTLIHMAVEDSLHTAIQLRDIARERLGRPAWKPSGCSARGVRAADAGLATTPHNEAAAVSREWQPFPVELLPPAVRDYVKQTAEGMACDPTLVAVPMLAGLAAAIGNTRTIMLNHDWVEPSILWVAVVADSGSLKTPASRKALRFITQQESEIEQRNAAARDDYEQELVVHESRLATWKHQSRKSGDSAGPPPMKPSKPPRTAYVVSDTTIEAVVGILADNPRGVLLERDELAGWLAGFDKYKAGGAGRVSSEVGHWLSMHNAGTLRLDRKSTGRTFVERASLSITGGIQPDTLVQAIGQEHVANGLLARFLLAAPPRRPKRFTTATADFAAVESARQLFATLYGLPMPEDGPKALRLCRDGLDAWEVFYRRHADRQMEAKGVEASMLAKIEAAAARLALIHHVCRQAGDEPTLSHDVDAQSVEVGIRLAEWFADEWLRVYESTVGGTANRDHDGELLAWIDAQGGEVAVRDIGQRLRRYRDADLLERTITATVHAGRLESFTVKNENGGPPAHWVRQVPGKPKPK